MNRDIRLYEPHIQDPDKYIFIPWIEDIIDGLELNHEDASQLKNLLGIWKFCIKTSKEGTNE